MITDKQKHTKLISLFTAPSGVVVESYRTLSVLELDSNNQWNIKLGYGYGTDKKHIRYSNAVKFQSMEITIEVMLLLNKFKEANKVIDSLNDLFEDAPEGTDAVKEIDSDIIPQKNDSPFGHKRN